MPQLRGNEPILGLNMHKKILLATNDENSQEHWKKEKLVEEINIENNYEKDFHYMKEESF
jgi:hypothetical protein